MSEKSSENQPIKQGETSASARAWISILLFIPLAIGFFLGSDFESTDVASPVLPVVEPELAANTEVPAEKMPGEDGVFKRPLWVTPKHLRMRSRPAAKAAVPAPQDPEILEPTSAQARGKVKSAQVESTTKSLAHRPKAGAYPKTPKGVPKVSPQKQPVPVPMSPKADVRGSGEGVGDPGGPGLETDLSWNSIPASGPPMNGHLKIKITPNADDKKNNRVARNLVVLIDVSGSMGVSTERIATPVSLMMDGLSSRDRAVVVAFSDKAKVFQSDTSMAAYNRGLKPLTKARSTNLKVGLQTAINELKGGRFQGRKDQLVILTDGLTSDGGPFHKKACVSLCKKALIPVDVLGYGRRHDRALLSEMARATGGKFSHVGDVGQLLESVMGDVLGLSGVSTRDNLLVIKIAPGVKASSAYLLGRNGQKLGKVRVVNREIRIPLGELREGEDIEVVLEVLLPKGETGVSEIAKARLEYNQADGKPGRTPESRIELQYSESWKKAEKNSRTKDVVFETQMAGKKR